MKLNTLKKILRKKKIIYPTKKFSLTNEQKAKILKSSYDFYSRNIEPVFLEEQKQYMLEDKRKELEKLKKIRDANDYLLNESGIEKSHIETGKGYFVGKKYKRKSTKERIKLSKIEKHPDINEEGKSETQNLLYDDQIDELLKPLKKHGFLGVIMSDQIDNFKDLELQKRGSFIMNLDNSKEEGSHWIACYWDLRHVNEGDSQVYFKKGKHNQGLYYFDSFGRDPSDDFLERIKKLMDRIIKKFDIDYEIYFWKNNKQYQDDRSYKCGWFAVYWLINMYMGKDPDSIFDKSIRKDEKNISRFIKAHLKSHEELLD